VDGSIDMTVEPRYRRRRVAVALCAVAVVVVAALAVADSGGSSRYSAAGARKFSRTSTSAPAASKEGSSDASTSSTTAVPTPRNAPVVETSVSLVDPTRGLISHGVEIAPTRSLPTQIWAPLVSGRLPLVVFAHGFDLGPEKYDRFCRVLASRGYFVAAPSFPLADPARGNGLDRRDIPNEAADIGFVITSLRRSTLGEHIDPEAVAVIGHSDGADAALMIGYQVGKVDPRVDAVVAISPDPLTSRVPSSTSPLLLVGGTADTVVPYSRTGAVFEQVMTSRYLLTLVGAGHYTPIAGGTPWTSVLDDAVSKFLDATVLHRETAADLDADLSRLSHSRLVAAG
jgi:pimeloyl-ACP methyl ester carboxylesterase